MAAAPCHQDEHDLNLSLDHAREIAPVTALALDPEQIVPSKDGKLNPATEATDPAALEPHMDLNSGDICVTGTPDSSPIIVPNHMSPRTPNLIVYRSSNSAPQTSSNTRPLAMC